MKGQKIFSFDKNAPQSPRKNKQNCGKLCGNCGKHRKITVFQQKKTNVPVENLFTFNYKFDFSTFMQAVQKDRIVQYLPPYTNFPPRKN
jgi:hypothetical protein